MQDHKLKNEPGSDESNLIEGLIDAGNSTLNYALSRMALFMTEAKIAMTSILLMLVMALLCVVLLSAMWGLLCWAVAIVLQTSLGLNNLMVVLVIACLNLIAAIVCCKTIVSLSSAIKFNQTIHCDIKEPQPQTAPVTS